MCVCVSREKKSFTKHENVFFLSFSLLLKLIDIIVSYNLLKKKTYNNALAEWVVRKNGITTCNVWVTVIDCVVQW